MDRRATRFPHIDSLRAIAAIAVLGTHAAIFAGADRPGSASGHYAQRLEVGVAIFFVISGFLLYRPFAAARAAGAAPPATGAYAWRRGLRIVPAYWLALTVSALILGTKGVLTLPDGLRFYVFGQAYHEATIPGGLTQAWTLCVEVAFYAFLPVWAWLMRRVPGRSMRAEALGLVGLAAFSLVWKIAVLSGMDAHQIRVTPLLIALPAYLDQFALGMGLAVLTLWLDQRSATPRAVAFVDRFPGASWLVALVAFWAVSMRIGIGDHLFEPMSRVQYLERHLLYAVVGIAMVLPAAVGQPGRGLVRRVLANRVLLWLGLVSYGIYLWHLTVLDQLSRWGFTGIAGIDPYLAWMVVGLAATSVVAAASWYGFERPLLRFKNLVGGGWGRMRVSRLRQPGAVPAADDRAAP
jgi:peptidoglycan/LPS O-acetylase OafA/YrhL